MTTFYLLLSLLIAVSPSTLSAKKHVRPTRLTNKTKVGVTSETPPPTGTLRQIARAPRQSRAIATGKLVEKHKKPKTSGKKVKKAGVTLHVDR